MRICSPVERMIKNQFARSLASVGVNASVAVLLIPLLQLLTFRLSLARHLEAARLSQVSSRLFCSNARPFGLQSANGATATCAILAPQTQLAEREMAPSLRINYSPSWPAAKQMDLPARQPASRPTRPMDSVQAAPTPTTSSPKRRA